jgi:hypothetical protein
MSWLIDDLAMLIENGGDRLQPKQGVSSFVFLTPDRHRIQPDDPAEVHNGIPA